MDGGFQKAKSQESKIFENYAHACVFWDRYI